MRSIRGFLSSATRGHIGGGANGGATSAAAAAGAPTRPVWLSIDPRTSQVVEYPDAVSQRLEAAAIAGSGRQEVRLAGLGGVYESLVVYLDGSVDGGSGAVRGVQENAMTGGKRDVRRLTMPVGATEVRLHVQKARVWRFADAPVLGVTEERRVPLLPQGAPSPGGSPGASSSSSAPAPGGGGLPPSRSLAEEAADREARTRVAAENQERGMVGLWEWCKLIHITDWSSAPQDAWGVYSAEQNDEIEAAWSQGRPSAPVVVGIRNYEVMFRGTDGGRQVDKALRKSRVVRRRAVTCEERDSMLSPPASLMNPSSDATNMAGECAICYSSFAESPSVPVVYLPGCGHAFHGACVQHIADKQGPCPFCRADVDWAVAMAPPASARGGGGGRPVRVPL